MRSDLFHRSLARFKKMQEKAPYHLDSISEKSDNQLVFAFWTCLQLERYGTIWMTTEDES